MKNQEIVFDLISLANCARNEVFEAHTFASNGDYEKAQEMLNEAKANLLQAHKIQTKLIQQEAAGNYLDMSFLMTHAQDHLMNAVLAKDLVEKMIKMYKEIHELKDKLK